MIQVEYTSQVVANNGAIVLCWKSMAYMDSVELLDEMIADWNDSPAPGGNTYRFFQSLENMEANRKAKPFPKNYRYPYLACLRHSRYNVEVVCSGEQELIHSVYKVKD